VHFLADLTLVPEFAEKLYRQLTKENNDLFTTKFIQAGAPVAFIHEFTQTNLTISETNFLYTEKKRFTQESFLKRCNSICRKLIEAFDSKVVFLRAISREDAKTEILRLFQENHAEVLDYEIIVERLKLDLQIVGDVCSELEKEALIAKPLRFLSSPEK